MTFGGNTVAFGLARSQGPADTGVARAVAVRGLTMVSTQAAAADHFALFVADAEASSFYSKWTAQNPGETLRWTTFRNALTVGQMAAAVPTMSTRYGASLVDGGVLYTDAVSPVATTTTTTTTTPPPTTTTAPVTTTAPTPVYLFDDEFSGAAGARPDASKWWATPWCSTATEDGFGCFNAANVFQNGSGQLVLRVSNGTLGRTYDFARLQTFREGGWPPPQVLWSHAPPIRIEARAKFAPGLGLWEGVWADGTNAASPLELDLQEFRGAVPTIDTCHTHGPVSGGATIDTGQNLATAYHVYWANYLADHVVFGIDGLTCGSMPTPAQQEGIRLSAIVGLTGTWGGQGGPPAASLIPADMLVDYVRVTSLG